MEFSISEDVSDFRRQVTDFMRLTLRDPFEPRVPSRWDAVETDEEWANSVAFCQQIAYRGWTSLWWPRDLGGSGQPYSKQLVLLEELAFWGAPRAPIYIGWDRVVWTLLTLGTRQQQEKWLPGIKTVESVWCQGFTEPDAGSDLASLRSRAVRDGDSYVISGQKVYTSFAHRATHCLVAVRTDPDVRKYDGITLFVLEMDSPGVTVRPIRDLLDSAGHFNEVFLDEVRVPAANMIGTENRGWFDLQQTLAAERAGLGMLRLGGCRRVLAAVERVWPELPTGVQTSQSVCDTWMRLEIETDALGVLAAKAAWEQENDAPEAELTSNLAKLLGSELEQRASEFLFGLWAPAMSQSHLAAQSVLSGAVADQLLVSLEATVGSGTSQIMRSAIAKRGLKLPTR